METDIFKILIIKFLNKNFPISKIKKKGDKRFRRGIYIPTGYTGKDDKQYYINDIQDLHLIYSELFKILESVFGVGPTYINPILMNHLNLL